MKVLVTGGTGFIGSHSVAALLSHGHQVRLLVRSRDRAARSLSPRTIKELGIIPRELRVTLTDTVRWLADQGHISLARAQEAA